MPKEPTGVFLRQPRGTFGVKLAPSPACLSRTRRMPEAALPTAALRSPLAPFLRHWFVWALT